MRTPRREPSGFLTLLLLLPLPIPYASLLLGRSEELHDGAGASSPSFP